MDGKKFALAALATAGLASPAPATAQVGFHLRNDTRQTQTCRLHRPHSTMADRLILRPGQTWNLPADSSESRRLVCEVGLAPVVTNLRPGYNYALILDPETGRFAIQIVPLR